MNSKIDQSQLIKCENNLQKFLKMLWTYCKLCKSFSEFNKYLINNQHICKSKINE